MEPPGKRVYQQIDGPRTLQLNIPLDPHTGNTRIKSTHANCHQSRTVASFSKFRISLLAVSPLRQAKSMT